MVSENNMVAVRDLVESIARPFPPECNWEDQARACQTVAQLILARLAQPDAQQGASSPASGEGVVDRFEAWWATYKHRNRDEVGYAIKKVIAFDAYQAATLQPPRTVNVQRYEDFSGEHREWTEQVTLATPLAAATQPAVPQEGVAILRQIVEVVANADSEDCIGALDVDIPKNGYPRQWLRDAARAALTGAGENGEQGA